MTPTLMGRWQTRIATLGTLGLVVTAIFALATNNAMFFYVLAYVVLFGLGWDIVYIALQQLRWDHDWPAAFQVANGITEGFFIYVVIASTGLPWVPQGSATPEFFTAHYGTVWLTTFVWVQGPMRAFFPRWRFFGGRLI